MEQLQQNYYITQDSQSWARELAGTQSGEVDAIADQYFKRQTEILNREFSCIISFAECDIERGLERKVQEIKDLYPDCAIITLDRFLLSKMPDVIRFGISRNQDGSKMPRQGYPPIEEQLMKVLASVGERKIILVDDGVFSGGTMQYIIRLFQEQGINVENIVVFLADNSLAEINGIPVTAVNRFSNLLDWNDQRDLGLSGKSDRYSRRYRVATARPYMLPFSDGSGMSCNESVSFRETSINLLQAQIEFLKALEGVKGSIISIMDAIRIGLPIPVCNDLPVLTLDRPYREIFISALNFLQLQEVQIPKTVIFDMDGTLYSLDGDNAGFNNSTLDLAVQENATQFIMEKEGCNRESAIKIMREGLCDDIGISNLLSKRYGISRDEYFSQVWGKLDPLAILKPQDIENSRQVIEKMAASGRRLILLTSAPKEWMRQVLVALGGEDLFEYIITGDQFSVKDEIFRQLFSKYGTQIISIGDQLRTDILPAQNLGFQTYQVSLLNPLSYLLQAQL